MDWKIPKIPLFKISTDEEEIQFVAPLLNSGMNWATGSNVDALEKMVAQYIGTKYAATVNSGTSGLHALLLAHKIGAGDEVIVPSFSFIATANSPLFVGAKPVFADIESKTYGLDPESVNNTITNKTKAIMPVHIGGNPCMIKELAQIAEDKNLLLIEDAAESMGSSIRNKKVGSFGDSAMFSYCAPKIVTTGEGGVIVTNIKEIYERVKLIRSHGRADTKDYFSTNEYMDYITLGYNFRMSNIAAAIGLAQMDKIESFIMARQANAAYLTKKIKHVTSQIKTPSQTLDRQHIYQMYTIESDKRDELMGYLTSKGIMSKIYFDPIHLSRFYKKVLKYQPNLPMTMKIYSKVLTLPMYPNLSHEEMNYIADSIKEYYFGESK